MDNRFWSLFIQIYWSHRMIAVMPLVLTSIACIVALKVIKNKAIKMQSLMNNYEILQQRINNQIPYIREAFLEKWLSGKYNNIDELKIMTKYLKAKYTGKHYCVIVIDYHRWISINEDFNEYNFKELEKMKRFFKDFLTQYIFKEEYIHDIDHHKVAIILINHEGTKTSFKEEITDQINDCMRVMKQQNIKEILFGIGNIYEEMSKVTLSFSNALHAMQNAIIREDTDSVWYDELKCINNSYYYPSEMRNSLYSSTLLGDDTQVKSIFRDILKHNVVERNLPGYLLRILINEIWGTLVRIQEQVVNPNQVNDLINIALQNHEAISDPEKIQYCRKTFLEICHIISNQKTTNHQKIKHNINQFILDNFSNPNFGLPMLADKYNLSYTNISKLFKMIYHESFINYLQKVRMDEVKRLLKTTDMPINEILRTCGYHSNNTFSKAFKRIHGVSASMYRQQLKGSNTMTNEIIV